MKTLRRLLKKSLLEKSFLVLSASFFSVSSAQATNGIFATVEGGVAKQYNLPSATNEGATNISSSLTPLSWRMSLGYNHELFRYLGFGLNVGEGEYGRSIYHYPDGATTTVRSEAIDFLAQFSIHIQKFDLIPRVGGARQTSTVTGRNAPGRDHFNNLETGIQLAYNLSQHFAVTATYTHIYGGSPENIGYISQHSVVVDEYLLGLRYTFAS